MNMRDFGNIVLNKFDEHLYPTEKDLEWIEDDKLHRDISCGTFVTAGNVSIIREFRKYISEFEQARTIIGIEDIHFGYDCNAVCVVIYYQYEHVSSNE